jgi:hypothetical protein
MNRKWISVRQALAEPGECARKLFKDERFVVHK